MHKDLTYTEILERMLDRVDAKFDKREGSIIWDALAPTAAELFNAYWILQSVLLEVFPDTATRAYLIKHCAERGITPKAASYTVVTGEFTPSTIEIPIGARFSHEDYNYTVTKQISDSLYYLQCETIGSEANATTGQLIPIDYINGLETAKIIDITIPGEDEEETETLRARYFESIKAEAFGGNKIEYQQKILSISGVGQVKIYSGAEWNGGGTVKAVITDSDNDIPSDELVEIVQTTIDPETNSGEGVGVAPIGHFVTVVGAYNTVVNIETVISYMSGYSWANLKSKIEAAVDEYLEELNEKWSNLDKIRVRIAQIESRILEVIGVIDIAETKINGKAENLVVDKDSLVSRGTINGN